MNVETLPDPPDKSQEEAFLQAMRPYLKQLVDLHLRLIAVEGKLKEMENGS